MASRFPFRAGCVILVSAVGVVRVKAPAPTRPRRARRRSSGRARCAAPRRIAGPGLQRMGQSPQRAGATGGQLRGLRRGCGAVPHHRRGAQRPPLRSCTGSIVLQRAGGRHERHERHRDLHCARGTMGGRAAASRPGRVHVGVASLLAGQAHEGQRRVVERVLLPPPGGSHDGETMPALAPFGPRLRFLLAWVEGKEVRALPLAQWAQPIGEAFFVSPPEARVVAHPSVASRTTAWASSRSSPPRGPAITSLPRPSIARRSESHSSKGQRGVGAGA